MRYLCPGNLSPSSSCSAPGTKKTIRHLREERGASEMRLTGAFGATLQDIHDLKNGLDAPSVTRLCRVTEYFGGD
jgi:predicted transcriptional regulator